jgi:hypothetical protein
MSSSDSPNDSSGQGNKVEDNSPTEVATSPYPSNFKVYLNPELPETTPPPPPPGIRMF